MRVGPIASGTRCCPESFFPSFQAMRGKYFFIFFIIMVPLTSLSTPIGLLNYDHNERSYRAFKEAHHVPDSMQSNYSTPLLLEIQSRKLPTRLDGAYYYTKRGGGNKLCKNWRTFPFKLIHMANKWQEYRFFLQFETTL